MFRIAIYFPANPQTNCPQTTQNRQNTRPRAHAAHIWPRWGGGVALLVLVSMALAACTLPRTTTPAAVTPGEGSAPSATLASLSTAAAPATAPAWPTAALPQGTTPPASGRTFFVAPHGDNANPGTRERPWASPAYGCTRLQPGDTLVLLAGTYALRDFEHDILRPPSGQKDAWVVIRGETGARPVLIGGNNLLTAIDLSGTQYVWVENLEITHDAAASGEAAFFRDGIEILGRPAAHIVLRHLYIHHLDEFGLNFQDVEDLLLTDSVISHAGFGALGGPAGEHGGWRHVTVQRTAMVFSGHYYQGGDGTNRPYDRPDGFGIEPSAGPIVLDGVLAAHNLGDGLDSKAERTLIRNSVVANNTCDGVKLWGDGSVVENTVIYGRGDGQSERTPWASIVIDTETPNAVFALRHVTVDDPVPETYLMYVQYDHPDVPVRLVWENSIFAARGAGRTIFLAPAVRLEARGNLFFFPESDAVVRQGEQVWRCDALAALGEANLCAEPRWLAPAWGEDGDYHLRADSPARDAGVVTDVRADLEGHPRDNHPDAGAYEWQP